MNFGSLAAIILSLVGLILAVVFGWRATRLLARARKTPALAAPANALAAEPADDVPTMRFKGEDFEVRFGGSRGYDRPADYLAPTAGGGNWTDFLITPVVTPLRPSRFSDSKYWTRYLPGVLALGLLFFVLVPLLAIAVGSTTDGPAGTFLPTAAQRQVSAHGTGVVSDPAGCGAAGEGATGGRPVDIAYTDDGNVFVVPPGTTVFISYIYGKPVFSTKVPLCIPSSAATADRTGVAEYRVSGPGTGYVYIPQPNGTVVVEIQTPADFSTLVYVVAGLTVAVLCFDVAVMVRLRRGTRARWTRV